MVRLAPDEVIAQRQNRRYEGASLHVILPFVNFRNTS